MNTTKDETAWVSPPSETILRLLYQKDINLHLFRIKTELDINSFLDLLHDRIELNSKLISILSETLGGSQVFWLNRYQQYAESVDASNQNMISEYLPFLQSLANVRNTSLENLLDSFKVSTLEHLISDYLHSPHIMFSKSQQVHPSPTKIANWIRNCEIEAEKILLNSPIPIFSQDTLKDILPDIVALSKINNIDKIKHKLKTILSTAGVILIFSPSEAGNGVSGLTKPLLKKYRLIVVTDRYKNNAAFWFTLLHEISHCILHSISRPLVHYSDQEFTLASLPSNNFYAEEEANKYVEELLFPYEIMNELLTTKLSHKTILRLAVKYDISAALITAQIHRFSLAPYSFYRKVYRSVSFKSIH